MSQYSLERKESVVRRMLSPMNISMPELAKESGISEATPYLWRKQTIANQGKGMTGQSKHPEKGSSSQKFAIVVETVGFNEAELAEYGRKKGLYVEQIKAWRAACEKANAGAAELTQQIRAAQAADQKRIKELERELHRKEKALAETAALLILRKKADAILWHGRGRLISLPDRDEAVQLINEAVSAGARKAMACRETGIALRTLERWSQAGELKADGRPGACRPTPPNKLTPEERRAVLEIATSPRFASLPPTQIVPCLADEGQYVASESSFYRILRDENCQHHRGRARAPHARPVPRHCATGPNQLYAWDITYLPGPIRGMFFFLYLMLDVYSRKIVAHEVHAAESSELAAQLIECAVRREGVAGQVLVVHQDNGSPMKGSTYLAKLAELGIQPSYSRPGVSDDNAYAESLFRTCKYRPEFPGAFASLDEARAHMLRFTRWYHHEHKHRNLKFVSPAERHRGDDHAIFARRTVVYEAARARNPARWSRTIRDWSLPKEVWLNRPAEESPLRQAA